MADLPSKQVVLAIDDEPENLLLLKRPISKAGHILLTAESAEEALKILAEKNVDVILLDWMMPKMSGIEFLKKMRTQKEWRMIPVIMITARDSVDDIKEGLKSGANDYISKPFDRTELVARVNAAVRERVLSKDLEIANCDLAKRNGFIRDMFGKYISDEVVEALLNEKENIDPNGDRRRVTIVMSDLRRFSYIADKLKPEEVLVLLNNYFEEMIEAVMRHNGIIADFIGDGMMILFGAPIIRKDDPQRATLCAFSMQKAMEQVNKKNGETGLPQLMMGIGIDTGEVVAGNIGSNLRLKYGVVGSPVNLSARVESCTVGGDILVTRRHADLLGNVAVIKDEKEVMLKGFDNPVAICQVVETP